MSDEHLISLQPGTVIGGKYEVVKCLGAGSMGMVYACRHRELQGQMVAAKVLFNEVAADKVSAARFKNEVLASYGVSHPNVVRAYEYIKDGELVAYTMEFVGGGDLADRMSRAELMSISEFVRLLSQMAAGVQAIHDAGIVHRDLKPENILLTNEGNIKIADFGIARNRNGPKLTEHGGVVGTIEYVAPEYMLRSQVDWRSDIYALGILAYEMVTGQAPFTGDSAYASISKRLQTDPEPPSTHRHECPPEIDAIILKALVRDPEERYQSAMEMYADLQKVATTLGVSHSGGSVIQGAPGASIAGQRYVGPSLSDSVAGGAPVQYETQLLTSDGSIDPGVRRVKHSEDVWGAESLSRDGGSPVQTHGVSKNRGAGSGDTEVLTAAYVDYSLITSESDRLSKPATSEPFVGASEGPRMRGDFRERHARDRAGDLPPHFLEASNHRLRVLDLLTFVFAAFVGIGCGFVFLRLFAPSLLEKLSYFGGA
jgi:serine/threonine protein kinase